MRAALVALVLALVVAGAALAAFNRLDPDDGPAVSPPPGGTTILQAVATSPTPSAAPSATPLPQPMPLPDRTVCAEIQGTAYRSETERAFFLANCLQTQPQAPAPAAVTVSQDSAANCRTNVRIATSRRDQTFNVSGLTIDEIDASLEANGPVADGSIAVGLTEYSYGFDGSFCRRASSCAVGVTRIYADIIVTLPNLTTLSQVSPDIKAAWERFAESVRIHEERHVTILEEGLAEMRRQVELIDDQPDCDALEHEVDKVWLLYSSQMERRQEAFHAADRSGQGGLVVR